MRGKRKDVIEAPLVLRIEVVGALLGPTFGPVTAGPPVGRVGDACGGAGLRAWASCPLLRADGASDGLAGAVARAGRGRVTG